MLVRSSKRFPFPKEGITVSGILNFIESCGGRDQLAGLSTTQVCENHLKPLTASSKTSYCLLKMKNKSKDVGIAEVFISHAWSYQFLQVCFIHGVFYEQNVCLRITSIVYFFYCTLYFTALFR